MQSKLSWVVGLVSVAVAVLVVLAPGCSRDDRAAPPAVDLNCSFAARCVGPTETSVARCSAVWPAVNPCCPIVHPVLVWACEPGTGKCLVFGDGCLPAGWKASPLDASQPRDRSAGELGALAGCTHDDAAACWSCGSCAPASVASVGCTSPGVCQLLGVGVPASGVPRDDNAMLDGAESRRDVPSWIPRLRQERRQVRSVRSFLPMLQFMRRA